MVSTSLLMLKLSGPRPQRHPDLEASHRYTPLATAVRVPCRRICKCSILEAASENSANPDGEKAASNTAQASAKFAQREDEALRSISGSLQGSGELRSHLASAACNRGLPGPAHSQVVCAWKPYWGERSRSKPSEQNLVGGCLWPEARAESSRSLLLKLRTA